jgi:Tfp pilus assembly protein PilZ
MDMWQGVDRRRFPRANYPCKIIVKRKGQTERLSTHTENIGIGGVCVILEQKLARFEEVELSLFLKDKSSPIHCAARIVWVVEKEAPAGSPKVKAQFDTGVEFVKLSEEERLKIEKVVEECLQKQNP